MYSEFCRHDNYDQVFPVAVLQHRAELDALQTAKSCLLLGPGEGRHDLWFIGQFVPHVQRIVAVEPDPESAARLQAGLANSLSVSDSRVEQTDIQNWTGLEEPVDLAIMMHMLYYVSPSERKHLFQKLRDRWLTPGGFVVVVSSSRTRSPGNANELYERLGTPMTAWEDIDADLLEAGFAKRHDHEVRYSRDFSQLDEAFLRFYQKHIENPVSLDDVRGAITQLFPDGQSDQVFSTFALFQKT